MLPNRQGAQTDMLACTLDIFGGHRIREQKLAMFPPETRDGDGDETVVISGSGDEEGGFRTHDAENYVEIALNGHAAVDRGRRWQACRRDSRREGRSSGCAGWSTPLTPCV